MISNFLNTPLSRLQRLIFLIIGIGGHTLYVITNRLLSGGVVPRLPVDDLIPLWAIWTVPYLLIPLWWVAVGVWAMIEMDDRRFKVLMIAYLSTLYISVAIFVTFPTYVIRPEVLQVGAFFDLVRSLYTADHLNNALPSLHMSLTTLIGLIWWDWKPQFRLVWLGIVLLTVPATLFTRQHYILDLVAGFVLACGMYWVARSVVERKTAQSQPV
jgi:hypothetical protein